MVIHNQFNNDNLAEHTVCREMSTDLKSSASSPLNHLLSTLASSTRPAMTSDPAMAPGHDLAGLQQTAGSLTEPLSSK